eukprot:TRINITY_DN9154_c0_g1_i3.p1 TRINITY_DN9154_c0_g1~~TRINITY_DN9154_c0_g1_i3.p1  ORF type:complete len:191 (-),score=25.33 TRINITY_DN9154_c0_g1_i3:365-937(-)
MDVETIDVDDSDDTRIPQNIRTAPEEVGMDQAGIVRSDGALMTDGASTCTIKVFHISQGNTNQFLGLVHHNRDDNSNNHNNNDDDDDDKIALELLKTEWNAVKEGFGLPNVEFDSLDCSRVFEQTGWADECADNCLLDGSNCTDLGVTAVWDRIYVWEKHRDNASESASADDASGSHSDDASKSGSSDDF